MKNIFFILLFFFSGLYSTERIFQKQTLLNFENFSFTSKNIRTHDKNQAPNLEYSEIFTSPHLLNSNNSLLFYFSNYGHYSFEFSLNSVPLPKYTKEINFHFYNSNKFSGSLYAVLEDVNENSHNLLIGHLNQKGWHKKTVLLTKLNQDEIIFRTQNHLVLKSIIYRKKFTRKQKKLNFFYCYR